MNCDSSVIYQYYATFCVNFIAISHGIVCGWPSPIFPILQSHETPLETGPAKPNELSWISSIMCLGGLTGTFIFGWIADRFGRINPMCFLAVPALISWILIICAKNVYYLIIARYLGGIAGGGTFVLVPLYVAEISEDKIRGRLGTKLIISCNIGILLSFLFGEYFPYTLANALFAVIPIVFVIGTFFLPESPSYLMKNNRVEEAEKSLRFFRNVKQENNGSDDYKVEVEKMKYQSIGSLDGSEKSVNDKKIEISDFCNTHAIKAMLLGIGLVSLNQLSGVFALINYTATIFKESGSNLSPNMSAIIVAILQLIGSYVSSVFADRLGRKVLLVSSALMCSLGLSVLGTFSYMKQNEYDVSDFSWIPVTSFSFIIFVVSLGVANLPFVVIAEIMPQKIRSIAVSFCMTILWILAFLLVKFFYKISEFAGMHGCMFLFAVSCFIGTLFVAIFIPETKGKSFDEIQKLL